jgi:hypothetical protein
LTDATLVSSSSATSLAFQRRTSRRMSTARWRAGRCCSAATKARRSVSRDIASSAGSPSSGSTRLSGIGSSQVASGCVVSGLSMPPAGPKSIGRARRWRPSSIVRQTFVAMRYSQDESAARPSKRSRLRHARSIVSCTASSASNAEPSMR